MKKENPQQKFKVRELHDGNYLRVQKKSPLSITDQLLYKNTQKKALLKRTALLQVKTT